MPEKYISTSFFALSFLLLLSDGLNGVICQLIDVSCDFLKFLCSIFVKGTQKFDFMKPNLIWKLIYKVLTSVKLMEVWSCFSEIQE